MTIGAKACMLPDLKDASQCQHAYVHLQLTALLAAGTTPVLVTESAFKNINTCLGDVTGSTMCLPAIAATHFTVSLIPARLLTS